MTERELIGVWLCKKKTGLIFRQSQFKCLILTFFWSGFLVYCWQEMRVLFYSIWQDSNYQFFESINWMNISFEIFAWNKKIWMELYCMHKFNFEIWEHQLLWYVLLDICKEVPISHRQSQQCIFCMYVASSDCSIYSYIKFHFRW